MVELRLLLLVPIMHTSNLSRLLAHKRLLLTINNLLVLLHLITRLAATGAEAITAGVALQVVFGADVATVDHGKDEVHTQTEETAEGHALQRC
jgi:hypothetical protein